MQALLTALEDAAATEDARMRASSVEGHCASCGTPHEAPNAQGARTAVRQGLCGPCYAETLVGMPGHRVAPQTAVATVATAAAPTLTLQRPSPDAWGHGLPVAPVAPVAPAAPVAPRWETTLGESVGDTLAPPDPDPAPEPKVWSDLRRGMLLGPPAGPDASGAPLAIKVCAGESGGLPRAVYWICGWKIVAPATARDRVVPTATELAAYALARVTGATLAECRDYLAALPWTQPRHVARHVSRWTQERQRARVKR